MPRRGRPTKLLIEPNAMDLLRERRFVKHQLPRDPRGEAVFLTSTTHVRPLRTTENNILIGSLPSLDLPPLRALPPLPALPNVPSTSSCSSSSASSSAPSSPQQHEIEIECSSLSSHVRSISVTSVDSTATEDGEDVAGPYQHSRWALSEMSLRPSQRALFAPKPARKASDAPPAQIGGRRAWDFSADEQGEGYQPRWIDL